MAAAHHFDHPDDPEDARDASLDPEKTLLHRALSRADVVAMLLDRREFHADRLFDRVESISIYTDSSPITGAELQGMVADITKTDGTAPRRVVLPGSTLTYGHFDAVSKTIALLWAIWLLVGNDSADLRYFCDHVVCICTDFGVEHLTVEMADCVDAFLAWVKGRELRLCRDLVNHACRLFPNSLRLAGWSHTIGGVMKAIAESFNGWPLIEAQMRSLVGFWRNETWRLFVKRTIDEAHPEIDTSVLKSFTASFAKWRYETYADVLHQLARLRDVSACVQRCWFVNPQDGAEIDAAVANMHDDDLHRFIDAADKHVFWDTEKDRHWGMICSCEQHLKMRAEGTTKIQCFWNSRRLDEAWDFVQRRADAATTDAANLRNEHVGGHAGTCKVIKNMLKKKGGLVQNAL